MSDHYKPGALFRSKPEQKTIRLDYYGAKWTLDHELSNGWYVIGMCAPTNEQREGWALLQRR